MRRARLKNLNLLDLKPRRNLRSETGADEHVTLIVPKFTNRFLRRWLVSVLPKPTMNVRLDEHGSFIWKHCDGNTTVGEISNRMKQAYGAEFDPEYRRIGIFVSRLLRDEFLTLDTQENQHPNNQ